MPARVRGALGRYLQEMLPEWLRIDLETRRGSRPRAGMISKREAAEQLGVSYPSLSQVLKDGTGAGTDFERAVARFRYGREDVTRLREEAEDWARANPPRIVPDRIERVLEIAAELGRSASDALEVTRALAARTGEMTDEEIARALEQLDSGGRKLPPRVVTELPKAPRRK